MPQPITHYMIVRRGVPKKYWEEYWNDKAEVNYKPYFGLGSSAPDLFYVDLLKKDTINNEIAFCNTMIRKENLVKPESSVVADTIHGDKSFDIFCNMLNEAKMELKTDPVVAKKKFAFALGFYGHVIGDCIIHPYVYRVTGDHWHSHDFKSESKHKVFEVKMDKGIYEFIRETTTYQRKDFSWECSDEEDSDLMNKKVWEVFNNALKKEIPSAVYPSNGCHEDNRDKLNNSYQCFCKIANNLLRFDAIAAGLSSYEDDNEFINRKIASENLPELSPLELFEIASSTCRFVYSKAFEYFYDENAIEAKDFFHVDEHITHYVNGNNWNLDTGLLSKYNNEPEMIAENEEHFDCHVEELIMNYKILGSLPGFNAQ